MGFEILAIASLAMKTLGTIQQNKAAGEATRLANEQANAQADAEIAEFDRQREETNRIAAEDKSERVIEADKQFASMIVSMIESGGAGTSNEGRFAGEIGGYEGIDLAKIESNRRGDIETLRSRQSGSDTRRRDSITERNAKLKAGNTSRAINLASEAVGTGMSIRGHRQRQEMVEQRGVGIGTG